MKQNPYPSILHKAQKSAFRQRGIGGSLLRTALAVLLLASAVACSDNTSNDIPGNGNDDTDNAANLVTVRFASGTDDDATPEARTSLDDKGDEGIDVLWKTSDEIGISAVRTDIDGTNETNKKYKPATAAANSAFNPDGGVEMQLNDGGIYTFTSYYPWKDGATADKVTDFVLQPMTQTDGTSSKHIGSKDFMWAKETDIQITGTEPQVSFNYKHLFPMLVFKIKNAGAKEVKCISVRSANGTTPVRGKMNISLANGNIELNNIQRYHETSLTFTTPMTQDGTGRLLILPEETGTELIIGLLTTDNILYEYTQTASQGLDGGKSYTFTFDLTTGSIPNREVYTAAGTNTDWQIADESGLRAFALAVNYYGQTQANATLTDNVTLSTYAAWKDPIGIDKNHSYQGTFNGGGYTISGLNIDRTSGDNVGLFGYLYGATVQNLRVTGSVTATTSWYVGGIAGTNYGTIENCLFAGDVKGDSRVGGIAGQNIGRITACFSSGSVAAQSSRTGGIAGINDNAATIKNCYSSTTVTMGSSHAGGIIGHNFSGSKVSSCYATGTVSATDYYTGGIAGDTDGSTLENCLALGSEVTRTLEAQLSFGRVAGNNGTITNCAAWEGLKLTSGINHAEFIDATGIAGDDLTTDACKDKTTYTSRGFDETVWSFDGGTFTTYLPWIKAFETFHGIQDADYRIAIPDHLKTAQ